MSNVTGFFDLQVNGYGGFGFNGDNLPPENLHKLLETMRKDGTSLVLATIVTGDLDKMETRLRRLVELREKDPLAKEMIPGFHIEGPFLSTVDGYKGAHRAECMQPANVDSMKRLLDAGGGLTRLVTLAPENDPNFATTKMLAKQGIRVSAGHTNASLDELKGAIDAGLSMFTHLGNGCPMQMHRHDNIVQRALSLSDRLWPMFIADGAHVALPALKNYLKLVGFERAIVVTDAVNPAGLGPGEYTYGRWHLKIGPDLVARSPDGSHLVGSVMIMPEQVKNLKSIGLTDEQAEILTCINPRKAMGMM
jgi:N-acetylglucosamine-6-phosphate deacetylase